MQRMRLNPNQTPLNVYIIFRVYSLEGKIGLRVYVDPETSRQRGELDFHVETWAVKPVDSNLQN